MSSTGRSSILCMAIAAMALSGCASLPDNHSAARPAETEDALGRALLEAFRRNDAKAFVEVLPEELRPQFGIREFEAARSNLRETLGEPVSFQFETFLEHPLLLVSVWKVRFERSDSARNTIRQEVLFRVIAGTVDARKQVISFNFL